MPGREARGRGPGGRDGAGARGRRHSRHGPPGSYAAVGACAGWLSGAGAGRADGGAAQGGGHSARGGRRLRHRARAHTRTARISDHQGAHHPHDRHRRRTRLRRPGPGPSRHARPERPVQRQVREALRRAGGGRARGGAAVRRRGPRGPVSRSGAFLSQVNDWTRRDVLAMLGAAAVTPFARSEPRRPAPDPAGPGFRIRTITAGTTLHGPATPEALQPALAFLKAAKRAAVDAGYEVQTLRIATQPFLDGMNSRARADALTALQALDRAVVAEGVLLSIGPVLAPDGGDSEFGAWAAELVTTTQHVSFSVQVASPERSASPAGVTAAGEAMVAIARHTAGGIGN